MLPVVTVYKKTCTPKIVIGFSKILLQFSVCFQTCYYA